MLEKAELKKLCEPLLMEMLFESCNPYYGR